MGKANSKEKIAWVDDLEKAVLIAKFTNKPVFLMILKSMCPTCKTLAPQYNKSKDIQSLSKYFVMTRCIDQPPIEQTYAPDGHYVPRILFLDSSGKTMEQFNNSEIENDKTKYFYPNVDDVVKTMRSVLFYFYPYGDRND